MLERGFFFFFFFTSWLKKRWSVGPIRVSSAHRFQMRSFYLCIFPASVFISDASLFLTKVLISIDNTLHRSASWPRIELKLTGQRVVETAPPPLPTWNLIEITKIILQMKQADRDLSIIRSFHTSYGWRKSRNRIMLRISALLEVLLTERFKYGDWIADVETDCSASREFSLIWDLYAAVAVARFMFYTSKLLLCKFGENLTTLFNFWSFGWIPKGNNGKLLTQLLEQPWMVNWETDHCPPPPRRRVFID